MTDRADLLQTSVQVNYRVLVVEQPLLTLCSSLSDQGWVPTTGCWWSWPSWLSVRLSLSLSLSLSLWSGMGPDYRMLVNLTLLTLCSSPGSGMGPDYRVLVKQPLLTLCSFLPDQGWVPTTGCWWSGRGARRNSTSWCTARRSPPGSWCSGSPPSCRSTRSRAACGRSACRCSSAAGTRDGRASSSATPAAPTSPGRPRPWGRTSSTAGRSWRSGECDVAGGWVEGTAWKVRRTRRQWWVLEAQVHIPSLDGTTVGGNPAGGALGTVDPVH